MSKGTLKRVLPVVFLAGILFISYIEFNATMQQIKLEHGNGNEMKAIEMGQEQYNHSRLPVEHKVTDSWKPVERKESYNNELQLYSKDNVVINGNEIVITAKKESKEGKEYTSGLVESAYAYRYGYFEFTIEIPKGRGIFPAIWFLPDNGNALPEIDLFEMIGSKPYTFYGVIHFAVNEAKGSDYYKQEVPVKDQYSVALQWNPDFLTWYIDGKEIYTTTQGIPQEDMYIIINQAIGGDWPGDPDDSIFPTGFKSTALRIEPVYKKGRN